MNDNQNNLCECGCGKRAPLIKKNNTKRGYVKGKYHRFLPNHHSKKPDLYSIEDRGFFTPCWIWQLYVDRNGYPWKSGVFLPRAYWEKKNGPIPDGLEPDHLCRQRSCINPDHLEIVTHQENVRRAHHYHPTHCPKGHEYSDENTYVDKSGTRHCRTCNRANSLAYYYRLKELQKGGRPPK